jgi:ATP-dependent RNA helicase DeaD
MTCSFESLGLRPELVQAVAERGYPAPMPIQEAVIPLMLNGQDVIGQAQTGTGKTAAFSLPILNNLLPSPAGVQALVLTPTRELAQQVTSFISEYSRHSAARVLSVYGGQSYGLQIGRLRRGVDIVVGTPGRLLDLIQRGELKLDAVRTVVLDEADEMLSMGFIEDIEAILSATPAERQTTLFSATLPQEIRRLAGKYLRSPQSVSIQAEQVTVEAIDQRYYLVNEADKTAALTRLFEMEDIGSALVFVRTRLGTGDLANELSRRGFPAEALSGDLSQEMRERTMSRFRQGRVTVLVATDVAARGLDIEGITHVFNFDLSEDPEVYVHRIGRTGRAGKSGVAISLVAPTEKRRLRQIEAFTRRKLERLPLPSEQDILQRREERLLSQVSVWLNRGRYKRERELVEKLVEDGADALEIAAAALKIARASEKQRPIATLSEVQDFNLARPRPGLRPSDRSRPRHYAAGGRHERTSHEAGMVRLSLNLGRQDGIRPNDIVGAIAAHAEIPGAAIGKIHIQERLSYVDIPEDLAPQVLARNGHIRFRKQIIDLQRA